MSMAEASSIAGINRLHTDAAIMTPAANPRKIFCIPIRIWFLKKKTTAEPNVVMANVKPVPPAAHSRVFMGILLCLYQGLKDRMIAFIVKI